LTIEGKLIGNPADAIFQMSLHMQHWRALVRPKERALLDEALGEVSAFMREPEQKFSL
jgi:hypothetical protein